MPDETQETNETEEREEFHAHLLIAVHFHGYDLAQLEAFGKSLTDELTTLAEQRIQETEGVFVPGPFGGELKPGDLELTDDDIAKLLNPEGTD